jgi:hypothetical protein
VARLVYPELSAAWQLDERQTSPGFVVEARFDSDAFALELLHRGVDVTAQEKEFVTRFSWGLGGMDGNFGRRKREDQPTTARVYVMQPKHVLEECSIGLGVMAVDDCVSPINHFTPSP